MMEWQPIETLSAAAGYVLLYDDAFECPYVTRLIDQASIDDFGKFSNSLDPVAWMPLPKPPAM